MIGWLAEKNIIMLLFSRYELYLKNLYGWLVGWLAGCLAVCALMVTTGYQ